VPVLPASGFLTCGAFPAEYGAGVTKLQIIGGGKMAEALLGGLLANSWAQADEVHVVEPVAERRDELVAAYPGLSVGEAPVPSADAVLAVKPNIVPLILEGLANAGVSRVLSIAAGVRTDAIEAGLTVGAAVIRAMPNTPALVGQGAAGVAGGAAADSADIEWASGILSAVGHVEVVSEPDLDAVTGLSGSGPAYVFHLAEGLIAAGIAEGLDPATADALARQTLLGAATLLSQSGEDPGTLRENVTSPNGTTAAGLAVFAEHDFVGLVGKVVHAAAERSRALGA
jgi:pyrroline-5-carboxylate reductase